MHQHFAIKSSLSDLFGSVEDVVNIEEGMFWESQNFVDESGSCISTSDNKWTTASNSQHKSKSIKASPTTISREGSHDSYDSKRYSQCTTNESSTANSSIRNSFQSTRLSPSQLFDPIFISHSDIPLNFHSSDSLVYQVSFVNGFSFGNLIYSIC